MKIKIRKVDFTGYNNCNARVEYEIYSKNFDCKGEIELKLDDPKFVDEQTFFQAIVKAAVKTYKAEKRLAELRGRLKSLIGKEVPDEWLLDGELRS